VRHVLERVLKVEPELRPPLESIRNSALLLGGTSLTTSVLYRRIEDVHESLDEVHGTLARQSQMLTSILCGQYNIPSLMILVPSGPASMWESLAPSRWFHSEMRLFFVCPVTLRAAASGKPPAPGFAPSGYVVTDTREWVKRAAPAIAIGLWLAKAAAAACGIPLPIPQLSAISNNDFLNSMCEGLRKEVKDNATAAVQSSLESVISAFESAGDGSLDETMAQLTSDTRDSYFQLRELVAALEEFTVRPLPADWRPQFTGLFFVESSTVTGQTAWVSGDGMDAFHKKGAEAFSKI
jgi:hypothetical protein